MNPFNVILWYYEILINTGMCATGTPPLKINMSILPTGGVFLTSILGATPKRNFIFSLLSLV